MSENMEEIEVLRARVFASEAATWLLEMDAWIGLHSDAHAAWRSKFAKALWSKEDLTYCLRGEGKSIEWAEATALSDAASYDLLLEEDARREAKQKRSNDLDEAA